MLLEMSIIKIKNKLVSILKLDSIKKYKISETEIRNIPLVFFEKNGLTITDLEQYINSGSILTYNLGIKINKKSNTVTANVYKKDIFDMEK